MNKKHQEILNTNVNYIRKVAYDLTRTFCSQSKSFSGYYTIRDELCSYAFEVMCEKIDEFDEKKGTFYNYAYNVLTPNLKNYYYRKVLKNEIENREYTEMLSEEGDFYGLYEDDGSVNMKEAFDLDVKETCLLKAIEGLERESDRELIRLVYFERKSILEASRQIGIKSNYHHHKRILEQIKSRFHYYEKLVQNIEFLEEDEEIVLKEYFFNSLELEEIAKKYELNDVEKVYQKALKNLRLLNKIDELPKVYRDLLKAVYFDSMQVELVAKRFRIKKIYKKIYRGTVLLKRKLNN